MISPTPLDDLVDRHETGSTARSATAPLVGAGLDAAVQRWIGLLLLAVGLLSIATTGFLATQAGGPSAADVAWVALLALGTAGLALVLPWTNWPHAALLGLATTALGLLVVVDIISEYSRTSQAAATYPVYVVLILTWVGFTQPRRTALAYALCAGSALAFLVLLRPDSAIPLSALVVVVPAGAALGEAVSWVMSELRAAQRRDASGSERLGALARTLDGLPGQDHLAGAAREIAHAACELFDSPAAQVLLLDESGEIIAGSSGPAPIVAGLDARTDLARRLLRNDDVAGGTGGAEREGAVESPGADVLLRADDASATPAAPTASRPGEPPDEPPGNRPDGRTGRRLRGTLGGDASRPRTRRLRPIRTSAPAGATRARDGGLVLTLAGPRRTVGVVALAPPRQVGAGQDALARLFAGQIGTVLEQFETIRALGHAVRHDELTGTGNRRHATELLTGMRSGDGLILVDIDHFKSVNDREGHRGGDRLLRALGGYLRNYVRGSDNVARFGGDEFIVVARGVGADATAAAERLLDGWRQLGTSATVSIGVAVHSAGAAPEDTLDRADQALYQAKANGRNQVATWSSNGGRTGRTMQP